MKRKTFRKQIISLLLSGVMVISSAAPAMAEPDPVSEITEEQLLSQEAYEESDLFGDSSYENGEIAQEAGEDFIVSDEETDGEIAESEEESLENEPALATEGVDLQTLEPELVFQDKDGTENQITVLAKNVSKAEATEYFTLAVWSDDKGQDDLKWYEMQYSAEDDAFIVVIPVSNHKSIGTYHAHLYFSDRYRKMNFVTRSTFEIHGVQAEKLEITDINNDKGTALVTISGVSCPSGVTKVEFPIWCKTDQSDLVWYQAKKVSEGTYQVTVDISKHSYHYGTYIVHSYGVNGNGVSNLMLTSSFSIKRGEKNLEVIQKDGGYSIKAGNLDSTNVKEIVFAIWSSNNGQDDLKWYTVKAQSSGAASLSWTPDEYGDYYIHCYAKKTDNSMVFQKGIIENVKGPSVENISVNTDTSNGNFTISVNGLTSPTAFSKVVIPVWVDANQKDLVWYIASKQADGTYTVNSNISKHGNRTGTYQVHLYLQDNAGKLTFVDRTTFEMKGSVGSLSAKLNSDSTSCLLKAQGVNILQEIDHVEFAVWSDEKGQDDLKWYKASYKSGVYSYTVPVSNHKTAGTYQVHLYAVAKSGSLIYLDKTTFAVNMSADAKVTFSDRDEKNASFKVTVSYDTAANISKVSLPVWCSEDRSDLVWYQAEKNADNSWSATIEAKKHSNHLGDYQIHVYTTFSNGIEVKSGEFNYELDMKDYLTVVDKGAGYRQVILANPSKVYKNVSFPTWSEEEGQNDLVWYPGTKQADGSWVADIYSSKHDQHTGTYYVHCYADDVFTGSTSLTFTSGDMRSIGEQKVDKYVQEILSVTGRDLYQVYLWVVNNIDYEKLEIPQNHPEGTTRQQYYFIYAYEHKTGNCFCYAAAFYYCALELGYNAKLIEGRYLRSNGTHGEHGWVEIYQNGVPYVCDPEIAWQSMRHETYMRPYGSTTLTYYRDEAAY